MRKVMLGVVALALAVTACANDNPSVGSSSASSGVPTKPATAAACAQQNAGSFVNGGQLTVGTDNPAYPPYFAGGETKTHPEWKFNDPYTGKGFEDAVAYEVAKRMGFSKDQVQWTVAPFGQTYKPGPKDYDFAIEQISYTPKRAQAVDFSDSYYDVNQAIVSVKGNPITKARSIADLRNYSIATQIGTTSYDFIKNVIKPTKEPGAYNSFADSVAALNAGQVDAIVVDLPTALYMADPFVQEVHHGVVVGQFQSTSGDHFGMTFTKGNPLVSCVNQALDEMKSDGTLQRITTTWLSEKTNVGKVPVLK